MGAKLRLAVAEHPGAGGLQPVPRRQDVIDLIADMMDSAEGLRSRNPAIGDCVPRGCSNSILVFGSSTKTTVTPCWGWAIGADTFAPKVSA